MKFFDQLIQLFSRFPYAITALLGRFALAATFWLSGQTKLEGFKFNVFNLFDGTNQFGWPQLSSSAVFLFEEEYKLPLLDPHTAAMMAASAEFILPILLLFGLATRFAALGVLGMTLVIQLFVYPSAYAIHSTWATIALMLIAQGGGYFSLDKLVSNRFAKQLH